MEANSRLYELDKCVTESITRTQFESRRNIFERIKKHVKHAGRREDSFYLSLISDWPAFLAWELTTPEGTPLFLSPWQLRADKQAESFDDIFVNVCRQSGKTTWEATRALKHMMLQRNCAILGIAPTEEQLIVRDNLRHFVNMSEFIQKEFLQESAGGVNGQEFMSFAGTGASFKPINLSGHFKRGLTGNVVLIDEYQLLTREKDDSIVQPMVSSAFTRKKVYRFMTPSFLYRPDLDNLWEQARIDRKALTIHVDAWQALDEGIRKPTKDYGAGSMQERFERLNISCPYVAACGACPAALPHWFAGEKRECCGEFITNDTFRQEDLALFPNQRERFFPAVWLHAIVSPESLMQPWEIARKRVPVVFGIDLGGLQDPTEIVINQVHPPRDDEILPHLETIGWEHIAAIGGTGMAPNLGAIAGRIKELYHQLTPTGIFIDITRKDYVAADLVSGNDAIPEGVIIANAPAEKHGLRGIWFTGEEKDRIYKNHQRAIAHKWLTVRTGSRAFWEQYFRMHTAVKAEANATAAYTKFKTPYNDHLLDAAALASAPFLFETGAENAPSGIEFAER